MKTFTVYSRQGCHLCEVLIEGLLEIIDTRATVEVCDIDTNHEWRARYNERVPVLMLGDQEICEFRLDRDAVETALQRDDRGA